MKRARLLSALLPALASCATLRPITASSADFGDYQDYALVDDAALGRKLRAATVYLQRHPDGAWAADVRAAFASGEERLFERAKDSREAAIDYLTWLPNGPHEAQAVSLVAAFDTHVEEVDERGTRLSEERFSRLRAEREVARDAIVGALVAGVQDVGKSFETKLAFVRGVAPGDPTWGAVPKSRAIDFSFHAAGHLVLEERTLTLNLSFERRGDGLAQVRIAGNDLFLRWFEADRNRALDARSTQDRATAGRHASEILSGMLEARMPAARCAASVDGSLFARRCDDLEAVVRMGRAEGEADEVILSVTAK